MSIFEKINLATLQVKKKAEENKLYGFKLLNCVYNQVDFCFRGLTCKQQDTIIMRIYDNLERNNIKFYF